MTQAVDLLDDCAGDEGDLGILASMLNFDRCSAEFVRSVNDDDFAGKAGQEDGLLPWRN